MTEKQDWIARSVERTPEKRAKRKAARNRRYADLMNKPRGWLADQQPHLAAPGLPEGPAGDHRLR